MNIQAVLERLRSARRKPLNDADRWADQRKARANRKAANRDPKEWGRRLVARREQLKLARTLIADDVPKEKWPAGLADLWVRHVEKEKRKRANGEKSYASEKPMKSRWENGKTYYSKKTGQPLLGAANPNKQKRRKKTVTVSV